MTVLLLGLQNEVDNYYKEYLSVSPTIPNSMTIDKILKINQVYD